METGLLDKAADFISKVGFPIFVAVWLLVRSDKRTKELTAAIRQLTVVVERCRWRE